MKFLQFFSLITFILTLDVWEKRSFEEDSLYIEMAVQKAFEVYSETNIDADFELFERLTIYTQIENGINYKMCFYDIDSKENSIQEFIISGPLHSNPEGEYTLYEKKTLSVKYDNQKIDNNVFDSIKHLLEENLQNVVLNDVDNIKFVENENSIFYFVKVKVNGKDDKYIVVTDIKNNKMELHVASW